MSQFLIDGVEITFPFEPYDEQKTYMKKVIECISQRRVGVLESPTGTGKTLSLLCATLSWLSKNRNEARLENGMPPFDDSMSSEAGAGLLPGFGNPGFGFPRVIYASRTHSQLSKAMSELQKTAFKNFNVTILGSRDQMCIHPQVMKEPNLSLKNALCSMHMKVKSCNFGNNVDKAKKDGTLLSGGIIDIEDLITKSKKINCCPYYLARELQPKADIVFLPYNYLFDYHIRQALKISLLNAIVIIDEAHNIDKVCEEAASVSIKSSDIALAITDITREMQAIYEDSQSGYYVEREYTNDELCFVKEKLTGLEKTIDDFTVTKDMSITKSGVYIFEILKNSGIDIDVAPEFCRLLNVIYEFLSSTSDASNRKGGSLKKLADDLDIIFSSIKDNVLKADKDFRVHIQLETFNNMMTGNKNTFKRDAKVGKVVHYWCFNPGYCMGSTVKEEVRCVILTSGTLAPLNCFAKELAVSNPVSVECNHIVTDDQVLVLKLEAGPRKVQLKCSFANRQNVEYWYEFGLTLQNFFRIIPDGVLIFFPGYAVLNVALKMWRESGLWEKLLALKPIFIEPQSKNELQQITDEYYKAIDRGGGRGAVFLGVCRGKISEGLDFSDKYGRAVIVAGLPYPPIFDPKVKLKQQYVDRNKRSGSDITGETWYQLEATKAVNQAIGRVIRHNKDYGAILLCDSQFNNRNVVQNLSKWVQCRIVKAKNFGDSIGQLRAFFRKNNSNIPSPIKIIQQAQNSGNPIPPQPSFNISGKSNKFSDLKVLEAYLSKLSSNITTDSAPSTSSSEPVSFTQQIVNITTLPRQLQVITNLVTYYEKVCNLKTPESTEDAVSCLERIDLEANLTLKDHRFSLFLINVDSLKNEELLGVLNKVLDVFEEKKKSLPAPPSSVLDIKTNLETEENKSEQTEISDSPILDKETASKVVSLISRLHVLNKHLSDSKKVKASDWDVPSMNEILPAKKRKIKIESIKCDDIQLPGSDERSRAKEKRLNDTKDFLLELKSSLEPPSYYTLLGLIKQFNTEETFHETVAYLRALLPQTDEELKDIFKRCYLLFSGKWEKEFFKYCEENNIV